MARQVYADNVDANGKVFKTVGENIRNGARAGELIDFSTITDKLDALEPEISALQADVTENVKEIKKNTSDISVLNADLVKETARAEQEEKRIEALFTDDVETSVSNWLSEHPEATTTVQDGSLTSNKFTNDLKLHTLKDYVTPEMFGAIGDGVTDDTEAVKNALSNSIEKGIPLLIKNKYYITEPILKDITEKKIINIVGTQPLTNDLYSLDAYGGLIIKNGVNLFENVEIGGSISRIAIVTSSRNQTGSIFYNSTLKGFSLEYTSVSNIGAIFENTSLSYISKVEHCKFLTVYWFAKKSADSTSSITDSMIVDNYINGGTERNDNSCFEWHTWNGCILQGNFIDFYRSIFSPKNQTAFSFISPISVNNQYQFFRYLYALPNNITGGFFVSNSDCFNWTNPNSNDKLSNFEPLTYIGHDEKEHIIPQNIMHILSGFNVSIKNAYIQDHCDTTIVFVQSSTTDNKSSFAELSCCGNIDYYDADKYVSLSDSIYIYGDYTYNAINIPFYKVVDDFPSIPDGGWANLYIGEKIIKGREKYKLKYDEDNGAEKWYWNKE